MKNCNNCGAILKGGTCEYRYRDNQLTEHQIKLIKIAAADLILRCVISDIVSLFAFLKEKIVTKSKQNN